MNKKPIIIFFIVLFLSASCQRKESEISAKRAAENLGKFEVNEERIKEMTGISCRILKSETLGYMPLHKFFWISVPEKLDQEKIERLAMAIINETIHTRPRTYHSFTIHFFQRKNSGLQSKPQNLSPEPHSFLKEAGLRSVAFPSMIIRIIN